MKEHLSSFFSKKKKIVDLQSLSAADPRPSSKFPPFANSHVLAIDDRLLCLITGVLILLILGAKPNKLSSAKQKASYTRCNTGIVLQPPALRGR